MWDTLESILQCIALRHFPVVTFIRRCLDPSFAFLHSLSRHDPILTKHQAFVPSGPTMLYTKFSFVRAEFCFTASARSWLETHDLRNTNEAQGTTTLARKRSFFGLLVFELLNSLNFFQRNLSIIFKKCVQNQN